MRIALLVMAVLMLWAVKADADTYYVRPDGDDANAGTSDSARGAWRTIDRGQPTVVTKAVKAGATEIPVQKASHFPPKGQLKIDNAAVSYTERTNQSFIGCSGTPAVQAGTKVVPASWNCPAPGDTVIVNPGVYVQAELDKSQERIRFEEVAGVHEAAGRILVDTDAPVFAVVHILQGGTAEAPLTIRGIKYPVIDGREQSLRLEGIHVEADYVTIEGFDVRRIGAQAAVKIQGKGVRVLDSRIHRSVGGVLASRSTLIEVSRCLIYDFPWGGEPAISLRDTRDARLHHNTIVNGTEAIGVQSGCADIRVEKNILTRCLKGIVVAGGPNGAEAGVSISRNLLWDNGALYNDAKESRDFVGFKSPPLKANVTAKPMFLSYDEASERFLEVHVDSPCVLGPQDVIGARGSGPWPQAKPSSRNLLANGSFEAGWHNWNGKANLDGKEAFDGAISLAGEATSGLVPLEYGGQYTLSLYAKATQGEGQLQYGIYYPSRHIMLSALTKTKLTDQWKRYEYTFTYAPDMPPDAGVWLTPLSGAVRVDAVRLESGPKPSAMEESVEAWIETDRPANVLTRGTPLKIVCMNRSGKARSVKVSLVTRGALHGTFKPVAALMALPAKGRMTEPVSLDQEAAGLLIVDLALSDEAGETLRADVFRIVVEPELPAKEKAKRFFSVGDSNIVKFSSGAGEEFVRRCGALQQMGVGYFRIWGGPDHLRQAVGPQREIVDRALKIAQDHDIEIIFTLENYPDAMTPANSRYTRQGLENWEKSLDDYLKIFGSRTAVWELMNEPNAHSDDALTADIYLDVCRRLYAKIKASNPKAVILGGSIVMHFESGFSRTVMKGIAGSCDAFSIHPYRYTICNPDRGRTYESELAYVKARLAEAGGPAQIWQTEHGWSPVSGPIDRATGSRSYYGDLSYDVPVRRIDVDDAERLECYYAFKMLMASWVLGQGGCYSWHTVNNVFQTGYQPTALLQASHFMTALLSPAEMKSKLDLGPAFRGYLFASPSEGVIAAIWPVDSEFGPELSVEVAAGAATSVRAWDAVGTRLPVEKMAENSVRLPLDRGPLYVSFEGGKLDQVEEGLAKAFRALQPIPLASRS